MSTPLNQKSTVQQIRDRFDSDVGRFTQLETGQGSTMDAPLAMQLITDAAVACTKPIHRVLDIGCGAGNNTIKLRQVLGEDFDVDLLDLSQPMLTRAAQRVAEINGGRTERIHGDFRDVDLADDAYDVVLAAAVLHHLRDDNDWQDAFQKIYRIVAPGGSVWITDLVWQETDGVCQLMWNRYGDYLIGLGGQQLERQGLSLHRPGRLTTTGHLSVGIVTPGRFRTGRIAAQECMLRGFRCDERQPVGQYLQRDVALFGCPDANDIAEISDDEFSIAHFSSAGGAGNDVQCQWKLIVGNRHFDQDLRDEVDGVLRSTIAFRVAALAAKALDLRDRHPRKTMVDQ